MGRVMKKLIEFIFENFYTIYLKINDLKGE